MKNEKQVNLLKYIASIYTEFNLKIKLNRDGYVISLYLDIKESTEPAIEVVNTSLRKGLEDLDSKFEELLN